MHRNPVIHSLLVLMLLAMMSSAAAASYPTAVQSVYKLTFINVGQGDAALLVDPNGFSVLIDGGEPTTGSVLPTFLRSQGITDIDVMVATHPDSDHIGGLIAVLQMVDVTVHSVVYNGYPGTKQTWLNFDAAVQDKGLTLTAVTYPETLTWGTIIAQTLNPTAGLLNPGTNDACLAFLVHTGSIKTLFACDLEEAQESEILTRSVVIDADLLKVGHHGSDTSSSQAFLDAITPTEAIISVGINSYDHPDPTVIDRLEDSGARVWRTDQVGNITVLTDGMRYAVNQNLPDTGAAVAVFLPMILRVEPPPPTLDPTAEPTTVPPSASVVIGSIFYDGILGNEPDEFVEILNQGDIVQLQGWTLSDNQNHVYTFSTFQMQPNQACRVYTNQHHPDSCGFSYGSGSAIWNNSGDCASLKNAQGQEVSKKCYP